MADNIDIFVSSSHESGPKESWQASAISGRMENVIYE